LQWRPQDATPIYRKTTGGRPITPPVIPKSDEPHERLPLDELDQAVDMALPKWNCFEFRFPAVDRVDLACEHVEIDVNSEPFANPLDLFFVMIVVMLKLATIGCTVYHYNQVRLSFLVVQAFGQLLVLRDELGEFSFRGFGVLVSHAF
jgi:hypothetical protein